jgi:hypothetical protein
MRMQHVALRQFLHLVAATLIVMHIFAAPVTAQSRLTDENWFDVKVRLRFDGEEIVSTDSEFSIVREGTWVDIILLVDAVLSAQIDFVFLKLNGETVLFSPGTYRAELAEHGNEFAIEAHGEAFVPTVDTQYSDHVTGTITWANPDPPVLLLSLVIIAIVVVVGGVAKKYLR